MQKDVLEVSVQLEKSRDLIEMKDAYERGLITKTMLTEYEEQQNIIHEQTRTRNELLYDRRIEEENQFWIERANRN